MSGSNFSEIITALARNASVFHELLSGKSPEEVLWRPDPGKWNLLEIVCHLHDEEIEDFRARVKHTLENRKEMPTSIDPVGWVLQRNYSGQNYEEVLEKFLGERSKSVEWLMNLKNPHWDNHFIHQRLGELSAGMFLTNWLAHDYLHIRQINRYCYEMLRQKTTFRLDYAGEW
jgi:hypothetical protein